MTTTENKLLPPLPKPLVFNRSMTSALTKMVLQLQRNHLVVLSGPSGSGKSTFATDTLCQYLKNGETEGKNGKAWRTIVTAPFADPIGNLATALARRGGLFSADAAIDREQILKTLREDRNALATLCAQAAQGQKEPFNVLLVVDQKEELFRYRTILQQLGRGGDDLLYVNLLLSTVQNTKEGVAIYMVFVADTRNFEYFAHYRGLPEAMNNFRMELPDITSEEIRAILNTYRQSQALAIHREENKKIARKEDQERADKNLAFFEWLAEQPTFVERLLADFEQLKGDVHATQKFNLLLCWVVDKCAHEAEQGSTPDPLKVYERLGPMSQVVSKFVEKEVWRKLSPEQKQHTELLFKALTNQNNQRRPLQWKNLQTLVSREKPFLVEQAREILSKFNATSEIFILPSDWEVWPDQVVDINADILIKDWPTLQKWIEEEQKHADIYRDLAETAIAFFSKKEAKQGSGTGTVKRGAPGRESLWEVLKDWWSNIYPSNSPEPQEETEKSPYYEGATLASALKWRDEQKPNTDWAARYDPPLYDPQYKQSRAALPPTLEYVSDWELAQHFLEISETQEQLKKQQEKLARQKILALQRKSVTAAGLASVACIAALVFLVLAIRTNQKVKMVDFVELLEANGCLDISPAERFDKMYELTKSVWKKNFTSEHEVLEYLTKRHVLSIDTSDQESKQISFDALSNICQLFEAQIKDDTLGDETLGQLLSICDRAQKYPKKQFPMVYHALLAHRYAQRNRLYLGQTSNASAPRAAIEGNSALITNPINPHEYVYGDKNGRIFIKNRDRGTDILARLDHEIKSIGFSPDGKRLYAGTKRGDVYRLDYGNYHRGITQNIQTHIRKGRGTPVYFIQEWEENHLVMGTTDTVCFLRRPAAPGAFYEARHTTKISSVPVVRCREWSPNHTWFFASGQDTTAIYRLDPEMGIQETARVAHQDKTITALAIKFDSLGKLWLALGSEEGDIWLAAAKDTSLLNRGCDLSDTRWFSHYKGVHEASISSLKFNGQGQQMASAGLYGFIYLWNLNDPGERSERIRVRNRGEGVSAIAYAKNPDDLVVYEGLNSWVLKTNIGALKAELEQILKR